MLFVLCGPWFCKWKKKEEEGEEEGEKRGGGESVCKEELW